MTDVMQEIAARASAKPVYTQPIRIPRSQSPKLSQCQRTCWTLAVFIWGVTTGVLLHTALQHYFPKSYAPTTAQRATQ
jgi:hypothetical protein